MTVQKFRMATNPVEAAAIPADFPCEEYVIKAQVTNIFLNGLRIYMYFLTLTHTNFIQYALH